MIVGVGAGVGVGGDVGAPLPMPDYEAGMLVGSLEDLCCLGQSPDLPSYLRAHDAHGSSEGGRTTADGGGENGAEAGTGPRTLCVVRAEAGAGPQTLCVVRGGGPAAGLPGNVPEAADVSEAPLGR